MATCNPQASTNFKNFIYLSQLLIDVSSDLLRKVLYQRVPPNIFSIALRNAKKDLLKCLNHEEIQLLYPRVCAFHGTYGQFDVTLLCKLLRSIGNIPPHKNGWGFPPDQNDRCLSANIDRIRIVKNKMYSHLKNTNIDDITFNDIWKELSQSITEIENQNLFTQCVQQQVQNILSDPIDPDMEEAYRKKLELLKRSEIELKVDVTDAKEEVKSLKENTRRQLNDVEASIADIHSKQEETSADVVETKEEVESLKENTERQFNYMETTIHGINRKQETASADVAETKQEVELLKKNTGQQLNDAVTKIDDIRRKQEETSADIAEANQEVASLKETTGRQLNDVETKIDDISRKQEETSVAETKQEVESLKENTERQFNYMESTIHGISRQQETASADVAETKQEVESLKKNTRQQLNYAVTKINDISRKQEETSVDVAETKQEVESMKETTGRKLNDVETKIDDISRKQEETSAETKQEVESLKENTERQFNYMESTIHGINRQQETASAETKLEVETLKEKTGRQLIDVETKIGDINRKHLETSDAIQETMETTDMIIQENHQRDITLHQVLDCQNQAEISIADIKRKQNEYKEMTNAEVTDHKNTVYVKTRALEQGVENLKVFGITIFIGTSGSGKSSNSLELMRKVRDGEIFDDEFYLLHLSSMDTWDEYVDVTRNTVIFLEDPLGTTTANISYIRNNGGMFRKIMSCVKTGKIKIIMTIRSDIYLCNTIYLQKEDLFHANHLVDLSLSDLILNKDEKRAIFTAYCISNNVKIVCQDDTKHTSKNNLENNETISETEVGSIIETIPDMGFPFCCKTFFHKDNFKLGLRYFKQPSNILLEEIENLYLSDNDVDKMQFFILSYLMIKDGKLETAEINIKNMGLLTDTTSLKMDNSLCHKALKLMTNKYVIKTHGLHLKLINYSILEAAFVLFGRYINEKERFLIDNVGMRLIFELVRTEIEVNSKKEAFYFIKESSYILLAERFKKEIKKYNCNPVVHHPALEDETFIKIFLDVLKDLENSYENYLAHFFVILCLYDKFIPACEIIRRGLIQYDHLKEGFLVATEFDNEQTINRLLNFMTYVEKQQSFVEVCRIGNPKAISIFLCQLQIPIGSRSQAFLEACKKGQLSVINLLLENKEQLPQDITFAGLEKACCYGNINVVQLLVTKFKALMKLQMITCLTAVCDTDTRMRIQEKTGISQYYSDQVINSLRRTRNKYTPHTSDSGITHMDRQDVASLTKGQREVTQFIIEQIKDIDCDLTSAFYSACCHNRTDLIDVMHKSKNFKSLQLCRVIENTGKTNMKHVLMQVLRIKPSILPDYLVNITVCLSQIDKPDIVTILNNLPDRYTVQMFPIACYRGQSNLVECILDSERKCISIQDLRDGLSQAYINHETKVIQLIINRPTLSQNDINVGFILLCISNDSESLLKVLRVREDITTEVIKCGFLRALKMKRFKNVLLILQNSSELQTDEIHNTISSNIEHFCHSNVSNACNILDVLLSLKHPVSRKILDDVLYSVCETGTTELISVLFKRYPNISTKHLVKAFDVAYSRGNVEAMEILLQERNDFPIPEILRYFKQACYDDVYSVLSVLIVNRLETLTKTYSADLILKHLKEKYIYMALEKSVYTNKGDFLYFLLSYFNIFSSVEVKDGFIKSCEMGFVSNVHAFLDHGSMRSETVMEGICKAFTSNKIEVVDAILCSRHYLSVDELLDLFVQASERKHEEIVKRILKLRKDLDLNEIGDYMYYLCAQNPTVATILFDYRKDVSLEQSLKVLEICFDSKNYSLVKQFLSIGTNNPILAIQQLFFSACKEDQHYLVENIQKYKVCSASLYQICFGIACAYGSLQTADKILSFTENFPETYLREYVVLACDLGKIDTVDMIINRYPKLEVACIHKGLTKASEFGNHEVVLKLIKNKPSVLNFDFSDALVGACKIGSLSCVKTLLGAYHNFSHGNMRKALITATDYGQRSVVELILQTYEFTATYLMELLVYFCDTTEIREPSVLKHYSSFYFPDTSIEDSIIRNSLSFLDEAKGDCYDAFTRYRCAILPVDMQHDITLKRGDIVEAVKIIISSFANLTNQPLTPIFVRACKNNKPKIVRALISCGLDVEPRIFSKEFMSSCKEGKSTLLNELLNKTIMSWELIGLGLSLAVRNNNDECKVIIQNHLQQLTHEEKTILLQKMPDFERDHIVNLLQHYREDLVCEDTDQQSQHSPTTFDILRSAVGRCLCSCSRK